MLFLIACLRARATLQDSTLSNEWHGSLFGSRKDDGNTLVACLPLGICLKGSFRGVHGGQAKSRCALNPARVAWAAQELAPKQEP